jgi:exopolysaccharide production protein ExoQ
MSGFYLISKKKAGSFLFVFLSIVLFSGAFTDHFVFGTGYGDDLSNTPKVINSLFKFPLYVFSFFVILRYRFLFFRGVVEVRYYIFFIIFAFISVLWSFQPFVGLTKVFSLLMIVLVGFGLAYCCTIDEIKKYIAYILFFILLMSLVYVFFIPSLGRMSAGDGFETGLVGENQGVFKHKNIFGSFSSLSILVSVFLLDNKVGKIRALLFLISLLSLFMANSATKIFAVFFAICFFVLFCFICRMIGKNYSGRALVFSVFLCAVMVILLFNVVLFFVGLAGRDLTFTGRTLIWEHAINLFYEKPFWGYGISSIWSTDLSYISTLPFYTPIHSHNSFVEIMLTTGLFGAVLLLFFIFKSFKDFIALGVSPVNNFFLTLLLVVVIDSCFEYTIFRGNSMSFLFLVFSYFLMFREGCEKIYAFKNVRNNL